jgi:transposase
MPRTKPKKITKPDGVSVNAWAVQTGVPEATVRRYLTKGLPRRATAATRWHLRALGLPVPA